MMHTYLKNIGKAFAFLSAASVFAWSGSIWAASKNPYAPRITLTEETEAGTYSPFDGSEKIMEELDKLEPINTYLKKSVETHNSMNRLRLYRENKRRYLDMVELHELSIEGLRRSEQCTLGYIGRYFNDPVGLWSGQSMDAHPEQHELRRGLSAWAIETFEVAKAAQVSPISVGDVTSMDLSDPDKRAAAAQTVEQGVGDMRQNGGVDEIKTGDNAQGNISNVGDLVENTDKMLNLSKTTNFLSNPSKEEEYNDASRKNGLIANDIGALASLELAVNPSKWGSRKKPFPVWNDVKIFYDQYLDGKYDNMKLYIEKLNIFNEIKNQIRNALLEEQKKMMSTAEVQIMQEANNAIYRITGEYESAQRKADQEYEASIQGNESKRSSLESSMTSEKNTEIGKVQAEKDTLSGELDEAAKSLDETNQSIEGHNATVADLQQQASALETEMASASEEDKTALQEQLDGLNSQITESNSNAEALNNTKTELQDKMTSLGSDIEKKQEEMTAINDKYDADISQMNESYKIKEQQISAEHQRETERLSREQQEKIRKINLAAESAKKALQTNSTISIEKIVNTTNAIIKDAKKQAYENIETTRAFLKNMADSKDSLYLVENHPVVSNAHQALLNSLLGEDASVSSPFGTLTLPGIVAHVRSLTTDLTGIVNKNNVTQPLKEMGVAVSGVTNKNKLIDIKIFAKALSGVQFEPDTSYFIGKPQKIKDFRTPKKVLSYNLPPLRELVRIDDVDLDNITEHSGKINYTVKNIKTGPLSIPVNIPVSKVDKTRFFTFAARTPEIWKLMLNYGQKAYVETEFDLEKGLVQGAEAKNLYRGGIFPCTLSGAKDVVLDDAFHTKKYDDEYHNKKGITSHELSAGVGPTNGKLPAMASCMEFTKEDPLSKSEKYDDRRYSELGTVLGYTNNQLCVSPYAQAVRNYIARMEADTENGRTTKFSDKERVNNLIMKRALISQNQIGDFLGHVETEQRYAKEVAELEKSVQDLKDDLYSQFESIGFKPSAEFDISKDSDYQLAFDTLDGIKKENMAKAKELTDSIKEGDSELLKTNKENYGSLHDALAKDNKAVTQMSMTSTNDEELDEAIKTGETNNNVSDEYQKKADEAMAEQKKMLDKAYCASY